MRASAHRMAGTISLSRFFQSLLVLREQDVLAPFGHLYKSPITSRNEHVCTSDELLLQTHRERVQCL